MRKQYRPSIAQLQREYSNRIVREVNRRKRLARRGLVEPEPSRIQDNSVPWVENPKTLDDLCMIALSVQKQVDLWGPRQANSSAS